MSDLHEAYLTLLKQQQQNQSDTNNKNSNLFLTYLGKENPTPSLSKDTLEQAIKRATEARQLAKERIALARAKRELL